MRSLTELFDEGGDSKIFAEHFAKRVHGGDWALAKVHWMVTVTHVNHTMSELDALHGRARERSAEQMARTVCTMAGAAGRCWACVRAATEDS